MEHLPPVSHPYKPVEVPYLGGAYSGDDFAGFPEQHGWDICLLQEGNLHGRDSQATAQFLQTWLYFGLLREVLGFEIMMGDFIRNGQESSSHYITTNKLRNYLQRWKLQIEKEKAQSIDALRKRNRRVTDCLALSYNFWRGLTPHAKVLILAPQVELSIQILAITLEHAVTSVCNVSVALAPWRLTRSDYVTQRMLTDGWCPCVIEQIWYPTHLTLQYYASILGPPKEHLNHSQCSAGGEGCKAKNIVDSIYRTKHTKGDCMCKPVRIDLGALGEIVAREEIPLLYFERDSHGSILKVTPRQRGMHYTAISHVWSDGLGNPHSNTLPECQAEEISRLVSALPSFQSRDYERGPPDDRVWRDPVPLPLLNPEQDRVDTNPRYFWMDTLCVPLSPPDRRNAAIASMQSIYSRAIRVLVLDAELMQSSMNSSSEEKLTRIICSTWIRRLWTLQEAILARSLYFQFSGESVIIVDPSPNENLNEEFYDNEIGWFCEEFDFKWRKASAKTPPLDRIAKVWMSLKSRATSKIDDEPICVAILLDMEVNKIVKVPSKERVKCLWSMYYQIPAATLFLPGEKLRDLNCGWAPARLRDLGHLGVPMSHPANVTPLGLSVKLPGFLLDVQTSAAKAVIACRLEGEIFYIRQNTKLGSPSWAGLELDKIAQIAVVLGQEPMLDVSQRPPLTACVGILVALTRQEENTMFVDYIRMVSVIGKGCRYDNFPTPPWSELEISEKGRIVPATYTEADQTWCVGSLWNGCQS